LGKSDINIIGESQGNIVSKYIIEECDLGEFKVHNYLSMGGPHQGVEKIPNCFTGFWCDLLNDAAETFMYDEFIQDIVAPTEYYRERDTKRGYEWYVQKSRLLPFLNNEKNHTNSSLYKQRFSSMNKVMLIMFGSDEVLYPKETSFF